MGQGGEDDGQLGDVQQGPQAGQGDEEGDRVPQNRGETGLGGGGGGSTLFWSSEDECDGDSWGRGASFISCRLRHVSFLPCQPGNAQPGWPDHHL